MVISGVCKYKVIAHNTSTIRTMTKINIRLFFIIATSKLKGSRLEHRNHR
jgi:hypothetical protein